MHYVLVGLFGLLYFFIGGLTFALIYVGFYLFMALTLMAGMYLLEPRDATYYKALAVQNIATILMILSGLVLGVVIALAIGGNAGVEDLILKLATNGGGLSIILWVAILPYILLFVLKTFLTASYLPTSFLRAALVTVVDWVLFAVVMGALVATAYIFPGPAQDVKDWLEERMVAEKPSWMPEEAIRASFENDPDGSKQRAREYGRKETDPEEVDRQLRQLRDRKRDQEEAQLETIRRQQELARQRGETIKEQR